MVGRPGKTYLPLPVCRAGHKRTRTNTAWVTYKMRGGAYVYLMARCRLCDAVSRKLYYEHRRKREARSRAKEAINVGLDFG
jgi:hypothetical protein